MQKYFQFSNNFLLDSIIDSYYNIKYEVYFMSSIVEIINQVIPFYQSMEHTIDMNFIFERLNNTNVFQQELYDAIEGISAEKIT